MKNKLIVLSGFILGLAPVVAFAQINTGGRSVSCTATLGQGAQIGDVLCKISNILNSVLPVLILLGVVYFVWGVISYVIGNDEEAKKKGRDRIIFGIIGLAVIIGMWGLVRILTNTFSLNNTSNFNLPTVPYGN